MSHLCWSCIGDVMPWADVPTNHTGTGHTRDTCCRMSGLPCHSSRGALTQDTGPIPKLQSDSTSTYNCCRAQRHLHVQHCLHVPRTSSIYPTLTISPHAVRTILRRPPAFQPTRSSHRYYYYTPSHRRSLGIRHNIPQCLVIQT